MNDLQNGSKNMYDIISYLTVINPRIKKLRTLWSIVKRRDIGLILCQRKQ